MAANTRRRKRNVTNALKNNNMDISNKLRIEYWKEGEVGGSIGTIRTTENYYVATIKKDKTLVFEGMEANTRDVDKAEVEAWFHFQNERHTEWVVVSSEDAANEYVRRFKREGVEAWYVRTVLEKPAKWGDKGNSEYKVYFHPNQMQLGGNVSVGTGVFNGAEFWRITDGISIGAFPKSKYNEQQATEIFKTKNKMDWTNTLSTEERKFASAVLTKFSGGGTIESHELKQHDSKTVVQLLKDKRNHFSVVGQEHADNIVEKLTGEKRGHTVMLGRETFARGGNIFSRLFGKKEEDDYGKVIERITDTLAKQNNGTRNFAVDKENGSRTINYSFPTPEDSANFNAQLNEILKDIEEGRAEYKKGGLINSFIDKILKRNSEKHAKKKAERTEYKVDVYENGKLRNELIFPTEQAANGSKADMEKIGYTAKVYPITPTTHPQLFKRGGNIKPGDAVWSVKYHTAEHLKKRGKMRGSMEALIVAGNREDAISKVKKENDDFAQLINAKKTDYEVELFMKRGGNVRSKHAIAVDKGMKAKHPGKHKAHKGADRPYYYEYRANRSDVNRTKKLKRGGVIKKDKHQTLVKFLVNDGEVFAYFPEEKWDGKNFTSYSHIGQHGACSVEYAKESKIATPEQYNDLKSELESIGYNLVVANEKMADGGLVCNTPFNGIYGVMYSTDMPDGMEMGWDADWGNLVAYKGKLIPEGDLPKKVKKIPYKAKETASAMRYNVDDVINSAKKKKK